MRAFSAIAPRYDLANHTLSMGLDFLWRRRAARIVRGWNARTILDVATGSGDLAIALQKTCPSARVTGADFCEPMLARARAKGVMNTVVADAMNMPFADGEFDAVTVAFGLRNMPSLSGALREMHRVLKDGGHLLVLDFSIPRPPLRVIYRWYLHRCVPAIAAALTGRGEAYAYLGASIEAFPQGDAMCALIGDADFAEPACERLACGIVSIYTARVGPG